MMLATRLPIILSSGLSSYAELDRAVDRVRAARVPFAVLQCTTAYPCPPEQVGINLLQEFRERYECAVGLSDHSGTIYPSLAAATLGASVVEVHVTLTREMFGPDVIASVTTSELRQLVDGVRFIERMRQSPADKDLTAETMGPLRRVFTRSLVARTDLAAGTILTAEHLASKKPGLGISPERLPSVVGRRLNRDLAAAELHAESDLEMEP
jgi:N-acetylneuraminate synthase